jgi:hypothetical protein
LRLAEIWNFIFYKSGNPKSKKIGGQTFEIGGDLEFDFGFIKIKLCFFWFDKN